MEPQLIVISDFVSGQLYVLEYGSNLYETPEDFFSIPEMEHFNINNCEYMVVMASEFQINFHP